MPFGRPRLGLGLRLGLTRASRATAGTVTNDMPRVMDFLNNRFDKALAASNGSTNTASIRSAISQECLNGDHNSGLTLVILLQKAIRDLLQHAGRTTDDNAVFYPKLEHGSTVCSTRMSNSGASHDNNAINNDNALKTVPKA